MGKPGLLFTLCVTENLGELQSGSPWVTTLASRFLPAAGAPSPLWQSGRLGPRTEDRIKPGSERKFEGNGVSPVELSLSPRCPREPIGLGNRDIRQAQGARRTQD